MMHYVFALDPYSFYTDLESNENINADPDPGSFLSRINVKLEILFKVANTSVSNPHKFYADPDQGSLKCPYVERSL